MALEAGQWLPQKTKKFIAICTQATTAAPANGTILENTLLTTGTPAWARTSIGLYTLTLTGAFTLAKTVCRLTGMAGAGAAGRALNWVHTSADVLTIHVDDLATPGAADSGNFQIEVEVYF